VMKQLGYKIAYQRAYGPFETDFTPDILKMQQAGVQMVVLIAVDQNITSRFLSQAHQQGWQPKVIWGGASTYTTTMVQQAGGPSVADGYYLEQAASLYLGQDSSTVPEVATFLKWVHGLYPGFVPDLFTLYGWTAAQLYVQGLKGAGSNPTSSTLLASLKKITSFDANGMLAPANPGGNQPAYCYLLAKVVNGNFQRVDMPKSGFRCDGHYQHAS
jgi:ABC-type branched-subunit amino acid transport system substrate-binding protein